MLILRGFSQQSGKLNPARRFRMLWIAVVLDISAFNWVRKLKQRLLGADLNASDETIKLCRARIDVLRAE